MGGGNLKWTMDKNMDRGVKSIKMKCTTVTTFLADHFPELTHFSLSYQKRELEGAVD